MKRTKKLVVLGLVVSMIMGLGACEKEKNGQAMFYSDVFTVINCIVDSVSLYVDDVYVGKIVRKTDVSVQPPFTGEEVPIHIQNSQKPFVKDFSVGQHSFYAKMKGDCSNHWKGTFKIEKSKTTEIYLLTAESIK